MWTMTPFSLNINNNNNNDSSNNNNNKATWVMRR